MRISELNAMSVDERRSSIARSFEAYHEKQYLSALEFAGETGPARADPTEEQRENVRKANDVYAREMREFGESLKLRGDGNDRAG